MGAYQSKAATPWSHTPFEIAFVHLSAETTLSDIISEPLFLCNRLVDLAFLVDMILCFNTALYVEAADEWVVSRCRISRHYLTSWFCVDLISLLPYDLMPYLGGPAGGSISAGGNAEYTRYLRMARLARLLKLLRGT